MKKDKIETTDKLIFENLVVKHVWTTVSVVWDKPTESPKPQMQWPKNPFYRSSKMTQNWERVTLTLDDNFGYTVTRRQVMDAAIVARVTGGISIGWITDYLIKEARDMVGFPVGFSKIEVDFQD